MRVPFTNLRKDILKTINESVNPLNANEIFELQNKKADLSTIYRALKYLELQKLIEGISIHCCSKENIRYYFGSENRHVHFIHCESCHRFTRFEECFIDNYLNEIEEHYHYQINHHTLFFTGLCEDCRNSLRLKKKGKLLSPEL